MDQRRGVRFGGAITTVLMVAGAVTSNQVLNYGVWSVPWLVAALVAAGLTVVLERKVSPSPAVSSPVLYPSVAGLDGLPLIFADASVTDVGVHDGRFTPAPYLARCHADATLKKAFTTAETDDEPAAGRVVLVEGPRLTGTTRTLAEAAKAFLSDHRVAWFVDDPQVPLADMIARAGRWARRDLDDYDSPAMGVVVWLERLHVVAWGAFRQALTPGRTQDSTSRIALLHAVTDWERARMPRLLTDDVLSSLFAAYRNTLTSTRRSHPAIGLRDALAWATAQGTGTEENRPALVMEISTGRRRDEHHYLPHPLLSALADDPTETCARPISTVLWDSRI